MRVVHLSRTFLGRTETFIYSQLHHLPPEKALVLTRNVQHRDCFPGMRLRAFSLLPDNWHKRWAGINYGIFRQMSSFEQQFYRHEIQTLDPDLVHAHFAVDAAYFSDVWRHHHRPVVVSCYGYDVSSFPNRYLGYGGHYLQRVWRCASLVLAMSNDMRKDLLRLGCPEEKIRVHYYGIDLGQFKYVERASAAPCVRILFVGRLIDRKGVEDVLRAFAQIANECPDLELRFAGTGPLQSCLEHLVRTYGLDNRVSFAGFVRHEELLDELGRAHIFCHPSHTLKNGDKEGIPGTIIEAMATGLPVVTTRHAGIPEVVRDGEAGFVVAEQDVTTIARALLTLVEQPKLRAEMGRKAMMQAWQKADAVCQTAELESIYDDVMVSRIAGPFA